MSFFVLTWIGIAVGVLHLLIPGEHHVGAASALALGIAGSWGGALFAQTFVTGGWIEFGALAWGGALIGAVGAIAAIELAADRHVQEEGGTW